MLRTYVNLPGATRYLGKLEIAAILAAQVGRELSRMPQVAAGWGDC